MTNKSNILWARLVFVLTVFVFLADWLLPQQYNLAFAYLLAHFLAISFREKGDVLLLAVITTTLTIIGGVFKPREIPLDDVLLGRLPVLLCLWAATYLVVRFITMRDAEESQEEQFKALFQFATSGILVTDQSGKILMANPAALQLFGYKEGALLEQPIEVLIPKKLATKHIAHRQSYHQNPGPRSMGIGLDLKGLKRDGTEFPVEVSLSPFKSAGKSYVVAFVVDNTFRKNYENSILEQKQSLANLSDELQDLNESLEKKVADRTAELEQAKNELSGALEKERELGELKSRFVSMASHEFRTPLTSVLTSAGLAAQYADRQDFEQVKKHTSRIKNAVNGLNSILTDFLSLGRIEDGQVTVNWTEHDLPACVAAVLDHLKSVMKEGQTFDYQHIGSPKVMLDDNLCRNILINLISNAIKYSPEGAPIAVETSVVASRTRISVRDRGIGIPEAEQKHLFDRFFRASNAVNSTQGTGLGLFIVQRYAEALNGKVGFESSEDGSVFWVEF